MGGLRPNLQGSGPRLHPYELHGRETRAGGCGQAPDFLRVAGAECWGGGLPALTALCDLEQDSNQCLAHRTVQCGPGGWGGERDKAHRQGESLLRV